MITHRDTLTICGENRIRELLEIEKKYNKLIEEAEHLNNVLNGYKRTIAEYAKREALEEK